jgi:hypothetical protein
VKKPRKPASPVCYLDSPEVDPAYVWAETDQRPSPQPSPRKRGAWGQKAGKAGLASPRPAKAGRGTG